MQNFKNNSQADGFSYNFSVINRNNRQNHRHRWLLRWYNSSVCKGYSFVSAFRTLYFVFFQRIVAADSQWLPTVCHLPPRQKITQSVSVSLCHLRGSFSYAFQCRQVPRPLFHGFLAFMLILIFSPFAVKCCVWFTQMSHNSNNDMVVVTLHPL